MFHDKVRDLFSTRNADFILGATERGATRQLYAAVKYVLVTTGGETTDVVNIGSAQMITANMVPDKGGLWMYHCHVSDHMAAGMMTHYEVLP